MDPSDPDALSQVLVIPGAVREEGSPPQQGSGEGAPAVNGGASLSATSGEQAVLRFNYTSRTGYQNCYVQVRGARDYFRIPGNSPSNGGEIQIPINLPSSVATGGFRLYTCIAGANGLVSNPLDTSVDVFNPDDDDSGGGPGTTCSQQSSVGGCTLDFCIEAAGASCYYRVGGSKISCPDCQNLNACAKTATDRLLACTR